MTKLSFIVPVYNVAPYLRKCVDSLLAQDYEDYEIILVDDGSTDASPQICDEYAADYNNIRVIHQPNGGLSAARNSGVKTAKGEYICFVDSDDYWEPNVLNGLMAQIDRDNLDVLRFDYQNVNERYAVFEPNKTPRKIDKISDVVDGISYLNTRMGYACYAWQFIIRNDIVNTFTPGLLFEDVDWLPRMMLNAKRVNATTTIVYHYFMRQGSITKAQGNKEKILKNVENQMFIIERFQAYLNNYPQCVWLHNMQSNMVAGVLTTIAREFYNDRTKYISRFQNMNVFPLKIADQRKTYIRRAKLINVLGPNIFCFIMQYK